MSIGWETIPHFCACFTCLTSQIWSVPDVVVGYSNLPENPIQFSPWYFFLKIAILVDQIPSVRSTTTWANSFPCEVMVSISWWASRWCHNGGWRRSVRNGFGAGDGLGLWDIYIYILHYVIFIWRWIWWNHLCMHVKACWSSTCYCLAWIGCIRKESCLTFWIHHVAAHKLGVFHRSSSLETGHLVGYGSPGGPTPGHVPPRLPPGLEERSEIGGELEAGSGKRFAVLRLKNTMVILW